MRILAGLELGGATLTSFDDLARGCGTIGEAVCGPEQLLRDLELRLGLAAGTEPEALRVARWAERMTRTAPLGRFYERSFEVDALGTARAVLNLRDSAVLAGWDGQTVPDGGPRLEAIQELAAVEVPFVPPGHADRVAAVQRALEVRSVRVYAELLLAEPKELWPARWQAIFGSLERQGTRLGTDAVVFPGAHPDTDLGRVQAAIEFGIVPDAGVFRGDGTFVRLTAETSWEAARATAAILGGLPAERTVVVRENDVSALDNALSVHGLRAQGWRSRSPWRAALQVLPLALELAFEPKDPYRVLELVTLPVGPFQGLPGHRLARALAESPGVGSPAWERAKTELAELSDSSELLGRISSWLEQVGAACDAGASKAELLSVVARVRDWIVSRVPGAPEDETLLAAAGHTSALRAALESDPRSTFSLIEVRRLAESILAAGTTVQLAEERAGRVDHVASAGGLRAPREVVLWWSFVDERNARPAQPWRPNELRALARLGIRLPDPKLRLAQRAQEWRQAILAATKRVILVTPRNFAGASLAPHPLWDEIIARTHADDATRSCIELRTGELLASTLARKLIDAPALDSLEPAALPGGRAEWVVPKFDLESIEHFSATGLEDLLGCPLRWALGRHAGIRGGGHALPPLVKLNGTLGHRLIELLHRNDAFNLDDVELESRAGAELDELFRREGAVLLRAGMGFERAQLRKQLIHAVLELSRFLRTAGLRILDVEKPIDVAWRNSRLKGRIDLWVATATGTHAIIDTKWGHATYRELIVSGRALQLAVYAFAHISEESEQSMPDVAYFSLSRGRLLGLSSRLWQRAESLDGPSLGETWRKVERTVDHIERVIGQGRFPVAGVRRSLPMLSALGIAESDQTDCFTLEPSAACKYCDFKALCGRRWEVGE